MRIYTNLKVPPNLSFSIKLIVQHHTLPLYLLLSFRLKSKKCKIELNSLLSSARKIGADSNHFGLKDHFSLIIKLQLVLTS